MNSLADGICQEIEQLINSSINVLKECERNDEATINEALHAGEQLIQTWSQNFNRLPIAFRDKCINDFQSNITDLDTLFFGFGNYAVIILSTLQKCLSPLEIQRLLKFSIEKPNLDNSSYSRLLDFILGVLESKDNELKVLMTPLFLDPTPTVGFDRISDKKIHVRLAQIYLKLMPAQNILHIQQFYPILVDKLNDEILELKKSLDSNKNMSLIQQHENILNLLLSTIYPLCILRNSFLIMALSPNLIDLCLKQLPTTETWFFTNFPIFHRNILSVAFTFAETYDFFVATSSLNRANKFVGESPSSLFCQEQIHALGLLLKKPELLTKDTLDFLIEWMLLMISTFGASIQSVYDRDEVAMLRKVVLFLYFNDNISTTKIDNVADNLKVFDIMLNFNEDESQMFWYRFKSSLKSKRLMENCHQIWKRIPAVFLHKSFLLNNSSLFKNDDHFSKLAVFDRVSHLRSFLFPSNKNAFDQRLPRSNDLNLCKSEWSGIIKVFASDVSNSTPFLPSTTEICSLIIDELSRIRNENGQQFMQNNFYNNQNLNRQNFEKREREHLRVTCLLSLVEQMDKSILTNTYSSDLHKLNQKLRVFNEMSLDLNAVFTLFNFAYKSGNYELIILFTTQYLSQHDFSHRILNNELLTFICWLVRVYVEMKDSQAINGLKCWIVQNFNIRFSWLENAEMLADGRFESASINLDLLTCEQQHLDSHNIVTETIFLLRERALRVLLEPSLCHQFAPAFYSQFMRPIGSPPIFNTELLNSDVVLELSSWNQFDRLRTPVSPPNYEATSSYNLFSAFDQIESNLTSMHKIFKNFGEQSVPDVLSCLDESEKRLVSLCRNLPDLGLCSPVGARVFPLQVVIQLFHDIIFSTNTVDNTLLNEFLLNNEKWSTFARVEMGQKIATWIEKMFGSNHSRFTELNSALIKLNRKTGNLSLANNYLNKSPRGILNQTMLKNNFGELTNLSEALKLEILRNDPTNNVGLMQKFYAVADLTASHLDIYLSSNQGALNQAPQPIVKSCLKLATLVQFVPINGDLIQNKSAKSSFWRQVTENLNNYRASCPGASFNRLLSGAFTTLASNLSAQTPKSHKQLAEWAMNQISVDITQGVDAIWVLPSEEVALHALCGLVDKNRDNFLHSLGQSDDIDEFQVLVQNTHELMNDQNLLSGIQSKSFEQLFDSIKKRQRLFFDIATSAFIKFLEHESSIVKLSDQISTALHLINLLTSHPNLFAQLEATANWIDRTNVRAWVKVVQQLFARLNHSDSFVQETLKSLIEKIGQSFPHAICYPAFVRSNYSRLSVNGNELNEEESNECVSNGQDSSASEICTEIIETLRSTRPDLIADLELFVNEFQQIVLLTTERWLFVLSHLEQDILRAIKQIEKEKDQLELMSSKEEVNLFVCEATTAVYNNALSIIEELYSSTCEGTFETVERQRFNKNFKDLIRRAIRKAKFEESNQSFEVFRKLMTRLSTSISLQSQYKIKLSNLSPKLAVSSNLSIPIPGQETKSFDENIVTIQTIDSSIIMLPTKTRPKKIKFLGSDGKHYQFLCKGQEDLRVDEQISHLFTICNHLFDSLKSNQRDPSMPYSLRSYNVTPLGPRSGLIQWVENAVSIYTTYRSWRSSKLNQYRTKRAALAEKSQNLDEALLSKSPERKPFEHDAFDIEPLSGQERVDQIFDNDFMAQQLSQNSADLEELSLKQEMPKQTPRLLRHDAPDQSMQRLKMSPIEVFASVLKSKLNEKNINIGSMKSRKSWPDDVLLEVFNELSALVPSTLISDELWMKSESASDWWQKVRRFSRSTAISSIVGALLGLGDRHLDNLLIDFATGQIIHVDFNVSFGKSKTLRVPESVPFRLTRNIVHALGPTKIEGTFRCSAEKTMELLRFNNFTITSMLSSFVHDPLAEWIIPSKQFNIGNLNIGISLIVHGEDQRSQFASRTALNFLHMYLKVLQPKFREIREELEASLLAICQLFAEMNTHKLNNGGELQHFNDRRVLFGTRLKTAIIAHQNIMRLLKPVLRILTQIDMRFANFMKSYRSTFSSPLVSGHRLLNEQNIDYIDCIKHFKMALLNVESVYNELSDLATINELDHNVVTPMSAISCEDVSMAGSIFQESSLTHNEKQLNEIGLDILNKCRLFLMGMDSEGLEGPLSVSEHVNKLIQDATNKNLLCKNFEGWCSWI